MMFKRFVVPAIVVALAVVILIHVGGTRAHAHVPPHCGFWNSIADGLSCE